MHPPPQPQHALVTHLFYLQIDAPDNKVVGGFLTNQVGVILQELKTVVIALHHAVLADLRFVRFAELLLKQPSWLAYSFHQPVHSSLKTANKLREAPLWSHVKPLCGHTLNPSVVTS